MQHRQLPLHYRLAFISNNSTNTNWLYSLELLFKVGMVTELRLTCPSLIMMSISTIPFQLRSLVTSPVCHISMHRRKFACKSHPQDWWLPQRYCTIELVILLSIFTYYQMFAGQGGTQYLVQAPGQLVAIQQPAATFAVASQQQGAAQVTITQGGTVSIKWQIPHPTPEFLWFAYNWIQLLPWSIFTDSYLFLACSKTFRTDRRYQRHIIRRWWRWRQRWRWRRWWWKQRRR